MRKMLAIALCGLVTGFGGRVVWQSAPQTSSVDPLFEDFSGQLPRRSLSAEANEQVVLIVSGTDILSCEDLGRQVRELVRTQLDPEGLELTVWAYDDAEGDVARFVKNERLRTGAVLSVHPEDVLGTAPRTPAVVVVDRTGKYYGLSYLNRTRLVRSSSFADLIDVGALLADSR